MTAQALGVVPACGLPGCRVGPASVGPAGFYSSSSPSKAGGYVAPPDPICAPRAAPRPASSTL
jgi:hypothetical protein